MSKKTLYISIGILAIVGLLFLVWFWFFKTPTQTLTTLGTFGSGANKTGSTTTAGNGNIPGTVGQNPTAGNGALGTGSSGGTVGTQNINVPSNVTGGSNVQTPGGVGTGGLSLNDPVIVVPGINELTPVGDVNSPSPTDVFVGDATWLTPTTRVGTGIQTNFTPLSINQLTNSNVNGTGPTISGTIPASAANGGSNGLITSLLGAGIGTVACTAGLLGTVAGAGAVGGAATAGTAVATVPVNAISSNVILTSQLALAGSDTLKTNFLDCITRAIARAALQQITASVVSWINSGFNGQPSFIKNPEQFFANVADQAAGTYLKSSALAFLCSPFSLQVKIAIAKSYAQRNSSQSCTLSKSIANIQSFMNGNFKAGGWQGLIQYTNMPANNPYGAYMYGQIGLNTAVNNAVAQKKTDQTLGSGFLSVTEKYDCQVASGPPDASGALPTNCKTRTTTPGNVVASSLNKQLGIPSDSLNLAKNFDEIINALLTQLMTKALYGLSNLGSGGDLGSSSTYTDTAATASAQQLLTVLQAQVQVSQSYGAIQQGSISDIQSTQSQLQQLADCWANISASSTISDSQSLQAQNNASSTIHDRDAFIPRIEFHNSEITQTNNSIRAIQELQTTLLSAATATDVQGVSAQYASAQAQGVIITQTDLEIAQQDRQTLQAQLTSTNQLTSTRLAQCNAFLQ